ncbi:hypothetical protein BV22DRAFT_987510, partial [Leucogyrophana mollusca]
PPTDEEIEAFDRRDPDCITITAGNFRLDMTRSRSSPFNKQALCVAAADFITKVTEAKWYNYPAIPAKFLEPEYVEFTLYGQMLNLRRAYRERSTPDSTNLIAARLKSVARSGRKSRLLATRVEAATKDPRLVEHLPLITKLSHHCVSSDEAEGDGSDKCFASKTPIWRSNEFSAFLWRLDEVIAARRVPKVGHNVVKGNPPRRRYHPTPPCVSTTSIAPPGLPINCYDPAWYKSLQEHEIASLDAIMTNYEF